MIALARKLLASCLTILQTMSSSSRFCNCAFTDGEAYGAMLGRLPSVVDTSGIWRLATGSHLAVGSWVADVVVVMRCCDGNDPIIWECLVTRGTNGLS